MILFSRLFNRQPRCLLARERMERTEWNWNSALPFYTKPKLRESSWKESGESLHFPFSPLLSSPLLFSSHYLLQTERAKEDSPSAPVSFPAHTKEKKKKGKGTETAHICQKPCMPEHAAAFLLETRLRNPYSYVKYTGKVKASCAPSTHNREIPTSQFYLNYKSNGFLSRIL